MTKSLRIATRNSPLALWQAQYVAQRLSQENPGLNTELVPITTSGDRFLNMQTNGGKGLFVKELEEALLHNQADLAVHSMKDVPAFQPDGLHIAAITIRENPYDAFVSIQHRTLDELPLHATVGTSSLRRQSQLLALRPDLQLISIRGNIQTRLEKMRSHPLDAIVLAAAGLMRMELSQHIQQILPQDLMLPACGQGALGIECRIEDAQTLSYLTGLHDANTAICVHTERRVSQNLGGNCQVPLAVYCHFANTEHLAQTQPTFRGLFTESMDPADEPHDVGMNMNYQQALVLQAKVLSPDGQTIIKASCTGSATQAEHLAQKCTEQLLSQGAQQLLNIPH